MTTNPTPDAGAGPACANVAGAVTQEGLTIRKPEADALGCTVVTNPAGSTPPNVCMRKAPEIDCLAIAEPLGRPINVIFTGCVASFGLEAQSDDLSVRALRETLASGAPVDPGYDVNGAAGMQAEKTPAALVGGARPVISIRVPQTQCKDLGAFEMPNVPTETNLILRVTDQHQEKRNRKYVDTYQYNIILRNSAIRSGPLKDSPLVPDPQTYCAVAGNRCYAFHNANTISATTFRTVALAAGVSVIRGSNDLYDGIGEGHVAGEVRDCTSEDKIVNAVVNLDISAKKIAYFNVGFPPNPNNIDDPKVEGSRTRTNGDGLYAAIALDTPVGGKAVRVGTAITREVCPAGICKCNADGTPNPAYSGPAAGADATVLATRLVYAFPDSITIMTFDRQTYTRR